MARRLKKTKGATEAGNGDKPNGAVPWPKTPKQLMDYINTMLEWPSAAGDSGVGYGRCVYSMANSAEATFNYVGAKLGVTGFQASAADLQFLSNRRNLKLGFMLLDAEQLLY